MNETIIGNLLILIGGILVIFWAMWMTSQSHSNKKVDPRYQRKNLKKTLNKFAKKEK